MRAQIARLKAVKRALRDTRGAAAVEFALVAGPLVLLICGCIELALIILVSVTLDNATDVTSRGIRTGVITSGNTLTAAAFKKKICKNMNWLAGSCESSLSVDVRTFKTFNDVKPPSLIKDGKFDIANFQYSIGAGSEIQVVTTYYEWPLFTPFMSAGLKTLANKNAVITSSVIFRNEPF